MIDMSSKVFMTTDISPVGLVNVYKALNRELTGNVGIKVHTGEPGGNHFVKPEFMKDLVDLVDATILECNTAYGGRRDSSSDHWKSIEEHGFTKYFKVDILDEEDEVELPIKNGKHIHKNYVGSHMANYDSLLILSHFKGHAMGGFGGALKNISIGLASSHGKAYIHGVGVPKNIWTADHDSFLESMAEAASSITDVYKDNITYINVMFNLSVDCDCDSHPEVPKMKDIGILASDNPVALDQACVDLVYASNDPGKKDLLERMESRNGVLIIKRAVELEIGTNEYELISID